MRAECCHLFLFVPPSKQTRRHCRDSGRKFRRGTVKRLPARMGLYVIRQLTFTASPRFDLENRHISQATMDDDGSRTMKVGLGSMATTEHQVNNVYLFIVVLRSKRSLLWRLFCSQDHQDINKRPICWRRRHVHILRD